MKSWRRARGFRSDRAILMGAIIFRRGFHAGLNQRAGRPRRDRLPRTNPLQTFDDDLFTELETIGHRGNSGGRLPELDPALLGLVVGTDREDVVALLVRQYRGSRDRQNF